MADAALQAALEQLAEADILLVQGLPPDSDYRFKHALTQDAAYESLLKSRRQVLHRRVAEILRDRFSDTAAAEPEVLAHHLTQAGLTDAAIEWWGKAGEPALRRSAFQEALSHLGKAIEMTDKTGEGGSAAATASASANQRLRCGEYGAGRGCIARCNRRRAAAEGSEFRAMRGALAGEALSLGPARGRPRSHLRSRRARFDAFWSLD
jgi:hypothetical protein